MNPRFGRIKVGIPERQDIVISPGRKGKKPHSEPGLGSTGGLSGTVKGRAPPRKIVQTSGRVGRPGL